MALRFSCAAAACLALAGMAGAPRALTAQRTSPAPRAILRPTRHELTLAVDFGERKVTARSRMTVANATERPVAQASFTLYRLLTVRAVRDGGGRPLRFEQRVVAVEDEPMQQVNHVLVALARPLAPGASTTLELDYDGYLAGYTEVMRYVQDRVDTAFTIVRMDAEAYPSPGWPSDSLRRAAGLPTYDYLARVTVPATHVVANGGELLERTVADGRATYVYRNTKPAWRMDFAIAHYGTARSGALRVYYLPGDSAGAGRLLDTMQRTMTLYTSWFGALPDAPGFSIIEVPDGYGSQADVSSILLTSPGFRDPRRAHELYHEIAHIWMPQATEKPDPRWDEGFASFLEELVTEELEQRPALAARAEVVAKWLRGQVTRDTLLARVPPVDYGRGGITNYSYSVGLLMFYGFFRLVGADAFRATIRDYCARYHATGGSTAQLVEAARRATPIDLTEYWQDWLFTAAWRERLAKYGTFAEVIESYRARGTGTSGGEGERERGGDGAR